ncbi:hypothetical protein COB52_01400 [Candidatus Kaiserbacteria bacterium]|nr:MAG: hypothetical protein COB52_01400 [Candidatus Kaiserbacteria bacterium]
MRHKIKFTKTAGQIIISVKTAKSVLRKRLEEYQAKFAEKPVQKEGSRRKRITARISWKAHTFVCPNCPARHKPSRKDIQCSCGVDIKVRRRGIFS